MSVVEVRGSAVSADRLLEGIPGRGAQDIADGLRRLIDSGALAGGSQLPTIREFARAASVSVGTVLSAWNQLREAGVIETRRRGGTIVRPRTPSPAPAEREELDWSAIDFQQGAPDISLQPDLSAALLQSLTAKNLNVFGREYMTDRLQKAVAPSWPFEAEAWTTAGGGTEALLLATAAVAEPGSLVAIDEPASPGFLETLRDLGLTPVPVQMDADGPVPESLARAIADGAVAFVFQPGGPFATDYTLTPERVEELARVLSADGGAVTVVEDDSIGPLAQQEPFTLGRSLPGRVLRVRSYCKAYGIDVRTSVIGGPRRLVARTIELRSHGVGSNSRILQNTLASLIGSAEAAECVAVARAHYARRKEALRAALEARGLVVHAGPASIVLWVEVPDETDALVGLAAQGVLAAGASKSFVRPPAQPMIRLSPLQLDERRPELFERLATAVQQATRDGRREFFD